MDKLLDKMFIKRFCLSNNTEIEHYEYGDSHTNINECLCGPFNHVACVLQDKRHFKFW
jgi:hypothetical protein